MHTLIRNSLLSHRSTPFTKMNFVSSWKAFATTSLVLSSRALKVVASNEDLPKLMSLPEDSIAVNDGYIVVLDEDGIDVEGKMNELLNAARSLQVAPTQSPTFVSENNHLHHIQSYMRFVLGTFLIFTLIFCTHPSTHSLSSHQKTHLSLHIFHRIFLLRILQRISLLRILLRRNLVW